MDQLNSIPKVRQLELEAMPADAPPLQRIRGRYLSDGETESDQEAGLITYWRILRRNKWPVLITVCICALLGLLIGIPQTPVYRAITTLEVLNLNEDFMNMRQSSPVSTTSESYETSEEETQVKLLGGSALLNRVLARLDDRKSLPVASVPVPASGWRSIFKLPAPVETTTQEKLLLRAAKSLKVSVTPRTRVITVSVDSTNPQLAEVFANTLTKEFIQMNLEARWATTHVTSDWIVRELDEARTKLKASEDALQAYARQSGLIFTDENTNVATEKLQQIQQELSAATALRMAKQASFEQARQSPPDSLADVLNDPGLRDVQSKISETKRQIADLSAVFNPSYSKLRQMQSQLDVLQALFGRQRADIVARIGNEYRESARKEQLLSFEYKNQTAEVSGQGEKAIQYNILKREVDSNRQLYDAMLQQMKQSSIASAMRASNVRVVDPADLLPKPVSPNIKLNILLGAASGLLLGLAFAMIRERADRTLQQPGDVRLWTNLPELGAVPSASVSVRQPYLSRLELSAPDALAHGQGIHSSVPRPDRDDLGLISLRSRASMMAEAFRSILTSILLVPHDGERPRLLVVTSAGAGDGKTTAVSNIAIAIASIGRSVLIIDGDLRRPKIHKIFNLENEAGLTDLLEQSSVERSEVRKYVRHTSMEGLDVVTSGPPVPGATNLLYSPSLEMILSTFRDEYDLVLVDTPPMLQMTDARVIGRLADAIILIVRAGRTTRDALRAMSERLDEDGCKTLGTILNDWNPKNSPKGYYGYYGNSSYYKSYYHRHE